MKETTVSSILTVSALSINWAVIDKAISYQVVGGAVASLLEKREMQ